MIGLLCLFLALVAAPFKSKSRLEAENAALRHQLVVLRRNAGAGPAHEQRSLVLYPAVSMVPVDPEGSYDHPTRDARSLASGRISPLLALEIGIGTPRPGQCSCSGCAPWAFEIGQLRSDHRPSKTLTLRGSLARSAGSAWTI
jgi:hypothetical protein